jgi:hypothetical protein
MNWGYRAVSSSHIIITTFGFGAMFRGINQAKGEAA